MHLRIRESSPGPVRASCWSALLLLSLACTAPVAGAASRSDSGIPGVIRHGPRTGKLVALTFDACSERRAGKIDTAVVRVLIQLRTPATIFLGGKWARNVATFLRPLASDTLFEFGNHCYMHPHLVRLSSDSVRRELRRAQRSITRIIGRAPRLFRAPYGEVDARVAAVADSLGLRAVEYDLASGDPDTAITQKSLTRYVTSMARGGSIIVMHINTHGRHTAAALPDIIAGLRKKGFTFVTISRLIAPPGAPARRGHRR